MIHPFIIFDVDQWCFLHDPFIENALHFSLLIAIADKNAAQIGIQHFSELKSVIDGVGVRIFMRKYLGIIPVFQPHERNKS